jgi:RimJ/RimL family protein N-acetyltransferase
MTAYYALWHDARRVQLTLHRGPAGGTDGFVAVCQTGRDLFVPLVVLRALPVDVDGILRTALVPGRPYTVVTSPALQGAVEATLTLSSRQGNAVYELEPESYRPVINVMVEPGSGAFRHEIRVQDHVVAASGVNWQTDRFADMYVYTDPEVRGRGWGKAAGAACVQDILSARLLPLYTVGEANVPSQRLAESLGFRDRGAREFECQGYLPPGDA